MAPICRALSIARMRRCRRSSAITMARRPTRCASARRGPRRTHLIDRTTEIAPGIRLISLVSDKPGTLELREPSLALDTPEGTVIVVGCSHPGIDKIVEAAAKINPRINLVAGGFHLVVAKDDEIDKIATALRDAYKVGYIAPGHCTGEPTFAALRKAFGERYLYAGLGTTLTLGATPRTVADNSSAALAAMDEADLESYRTLFPGSDDEHSPTT